MVEENGNAWEVGNKRREKEKEARVVELSEPVTETKPKGDGKKMRRRKSGYVWCETEVGLVESRRERERGMGEEERRRETRLGLSRDRA